MTRLTNSFNLIKSILWQGLEEYRRHLTWMMCLKIRRDPLNHKPLRYPTQILNFFPAKLSVIKRSLILSHTYHPWTFPQPFAPKKTFPIFVTCPGRSGHKYVCRSTAAWISSVVDRSSGIPGWYALQTNESLAGITTIFWWNSGDFQQGHFMPCDQGNIESVDQHV